MAKRKPHNQLDRLEQLRSKRTRIAKLHWPSPTPVLTKSIPESPEQVLSRDYARYLGNEHPLRVIFVGYNPSDKSWEQCAPYSHKSNRFWPLLRQTGLVPEHLSKPEKFAQLPQAVGIGFIDLFVTCGSDASKVGEPGGPSWRADFSERLARGTKGIAPSILCPASKIVANKLLTGFKGEYGPAGVGKDWGIAAAESSQIWVMPSTSGRASLSWQQRLEPFQRLADHIHDTLPWPLVEKAVDSPSSKETAEEHQLISGKVDGHS